MILAIRLLAIFLTLLIFVPNSFGQTYDDKAVIQYEGKTGYFFTEALGDKILQDLIEFKSLKGELVPELKLKISEQDKEIGLLKQELTITEKLSTKWEKSFYESEDLRMEEVSRLTDELNAKTSWYKKPAFVFIVGFVAGAVVCVGMAYGLGAAYGTL